MCNQIFFAQKLLNCPIFAYYCSIFYLDCNCFCYNYHHNLCCEYNCNWLVVFSLSKSLSHLLCLYHNCKQYFFNCPTKSLKCIFHHLYFSGFCRKYHYDFFFQYNQVQLILFSLFKTFDYSFCSYCNYYYGFHFQYYQNKQVKQQINSICLINKILALLI